MAYYNPNNQLIWVQGEEAAKAYMVAPNSTMVLWDTDLPVIYLKQCDSMGRPSMTILDFTVRETPKPADEIADLKKQLATLTELVEKSMKKGKVKNEPVVSDNESE